MTYGLPLQNHCSKHVQTKLLPDMENPARMAKQAVCLLCPPLVALTCRSSLSYCGMTRANGIDNDRTEVNWTLPLVNKTLPSCNEIWSSALEVPKLVAMTYGLPLQNHCSKHVQTKLLPDMENPARLAKQPFACKVPRWWP